MLFPEEGLGSAVSETTSSPAAGTGGDAGAGNTGAAAAAASGSQTTTPSTSAVTDASGAATTQEYVPNYKLKVMDQEKEIPESFRSLIKDSTTEKEVREIFEKAYGLDFAKPKHESTQQAFTHMQAEHNSLLGTVDELRGLFKRGDIDSWLDKMDVPHERMLQWALSKVEYDQLPPEQKAIIDARRTAEKQAYELQRENTSLRTSSQTQAVQARTMALDSELARTEVKSLADAFDQRMGRIGAFKEEVINRGRLAAWQSKGKVDLTPGQAVDQVIMVYGLKSAQASASTGLGASQASGGQQKTTTIPNTGSGARATSPVKQKPNSLDDLKKLRDAAWAK